MIKNRILPYVLLPVYAAISIFAGTPTDTLTIDHAYILVFFRLNFSQLRIGFSPVTRPVFIIFHFRRHLSDFINHIICVVMK